jgi:hypothetical protein
MTKPGQIGTTVTLLALLVGCQTDQQQTATIPQAPDAKAAILQAKGLLWKDPDSIKNASVTAPRRHMGMMWHVCVRANARNSFGGYTGEKDMLIGLYDDGRAPAALMADATGYCEFPHEPFPELDGGGKPAARPKA